MKIGIWLGSDRKSLIGGGGSYTDRFLYLVDNYQFHEKIELCYLSIVPQNNLKRETIIISQIPQWIYKCAQISSLLSRKLIGLDKRIIIRKGLSRILEGTSVKIVFYCSQCVCLDSNFPFISNNFDIGHRSTHSFPEVILNGQFEVREEFYKCVLPKSLLTICESETGKKELIDYTGLADHKIRVMPIFAGGVSSLDIEESSILAFVDDIGVKPYRYFYYPAQFWAHKNHVGLLKAFKEFTQIYNDYKIVFNGSDMGNKEYIINIADQLGIKDNVVFLGFISDEEVYSLYKKATALVMASHFGPTNMPPIEAMELGCPVACSDLGGHREILSENAVFFDSYDTQSITKALIEISQNRENWENKICCQKKQTFFNSRNTLECLDKILQEAITIRENWK